MLHSICKVQFADTFCFYGQAQIFTINTYQSCEVDCLVALPIHRAGTYLPQKCNARFGCLPRSSHLQTQQKSYQIEMRQKPVTFESVFFFLQNQISSWIDFYCVKGHRIAPCSQGCLPITTKTSHRQLNKLSNMNIPTTL